MRRIGEKTRHLILGTATPIQTDARELWDLLEILNSGAEFVLGDALSRWRRSEAAIPLITGAAPVGTEEDAWDWLREPLPPRRENATAGAVRVNLGIPDDSFSAAMRFGQLDFLTRTMTLSDCLVPGFFQTCNPVLRHVVLRKRADLEEKGLQEKVGVRTHPLRERLGQYQSRFVGLGIPTNAPFQAAYEKAEEFCALLRQRTKAAGFISTF